MSDAGHEGFVELGLRRALVEAAEAVGYVAPTPIQRDAIPMLRRGGNVVILASPGAGVMAAWGLAVLDRLAGEPSDEAPEGPRALVLVPTRDDAPPRALSLARFARAVQLRVAALASGWPDVGSADVLIADPASALEAVRAASLKLQTLVTLVLDGLDSGHELADDPTVETLVASCAHDAQRVVVAGSASRSVDDFVERHVRRAVRVPARPADSTAPSAGVAPRPDDTAIAAPGVTLRHIVAGREDRFRGLASQIASADGPVTIFCRTVLEEQDLRARLALRGFDTDGDDAMVRLTADPLAAPDDRLAVSWGPPFDAASLVLRHRSGGVVLLAARELPHLLRIADTTGMTLQPVKMPPPRADELNAFRASVRKALEEEDVAAQLLVLQPLFEDDSPALVAAALAALLRKRSPEPVSTPEARPTLGAAPPPAPPAYTRLFISVGSRDNVGPGDLVGAIAGEAAISGSQVGRIEIRDTFSIVEVEGAVAEKVIAALNGTTLRGRSVRVDYDRKTGTGGGPGAGPSRRGPRSTSRGGRPHGGGGGGRDGGSRRVPRGTGSGPKRHPPESGER